MYNLNFCDLVPIQILTAYLLQKLALLFAFNLGFCPLFNNNKKKRGVLKQLPPIANCKREITEPLITGN